MPAVRKQSPTGANGQPAGTGKPGSILSRAIPIEADPWVHMLLYGANRVGKTTLACTFPKPLLLVALEPAGTGGAKSVGRVPGIQFLRLTDSHSVETLGHELAADLQGVKSVVIDSGTSLDEIILAEICGWNQTAVMLKWGSVTMDQYRERSERMRVVLRPFLGLGCHVVVTSNEKDHNPPEGRKRALRPDSTSESFFASAMGGATVKWLQDGCDYVCRLSVDKEVKEVRTKVKVGKVESDEVSYEETGKVVRRLRTQYHPNFAAGVRSPYPERVPEFIDNPTYDKIAALVRGEEE